MEDNDGMPAALELPIVASLPPHKRWTREECVVLEREGLIDVERYELVDGELVLKVGKNHPHMRAVMLLVSWLRNLFGDTYVAQEPAIDLRPEDNPSSEPEPDVIVLNRSFLDLSARARPEDLRLVAEVSDTTLSFDLTTKARLYARSRIAEYWVVDLNKRRLIVHRVPDGDSYRSIAAFGEDEIVATIAFPDRGVRVSELL